MMKKIISSIILTAASLTSTTVLADPITHNVDYICPDPGLLANFGSYIGGFGSEILSPNTTSTIYFVSTHDLSGVPSSLAYYNNAATGYDGPSGVVSCKYVSNNSNERSFEISYTITNGKGGRVILQTSNTIRILYLVGMNK